MRVFIALDIPQEIRSHINDFMDHARMLAPNARWARVEGLHVTLKFVGEVSDAKVADMRAALQSVKTFPFEVRFEGIGFFPNPKAARVFWIGVDGGDALPQLAASVDSALDTIGFAREEKAYHPHLTLARAGSHPLRELQPLLADSPRGLSTTFGTMTAREFFVYQSQPQKGGSRYTKLERFGLENARRHP